METMLDLLIDNGITIQTANIDCNTLINNVLTEISLILSDLDICNADRSNMISVVLQILSLTNNDFTYLNSNQQIIFNNVINLGLNAPDLCDITQSGSTTTPSPSLVCFFCFVCFVFVFIAFALALAFVLAFAFLLCFVFCVVFFKPIE